MLQLDFIPQSRTADVTAATTGVSAYMGWLDHFVPHTWSEVAAMLSAIWLLISILQSDIVKRLIKRIATWFRR